MDFRIIIMFLCTSYISFVNFKNSNNTIMKEVGMNWRYYPKRYIKPKRWMKKLFKIKHRQIPKYVYFQFVLAIIFVALGPINIIIYICSGYNLIIVKVLEMVDIGILLSSMIVFHIISYIFKKH